jgi:hypothetical protein
VCELEKIVSGADGGPLGAHLVDAAHQELAEPAMTKRAYCWNMRITHLPAGSSSPASRIWLQDCRLVRIGFTKSKMTAYRSAITRFSTGRLARARLLRNTEAGINEHFSGDGSTVFEHARRLGAEGIVSKRVDGTCRSDPCPVWIKVRNPASGAVQREHSEKRSRWAQASDRH